MTSSPADIASKITIGHYLNGSAVTPAAGRSQPVFNPATGAVSGHVALASAADVDVAAGGSVTVAAAIPTHAEMSCERESEPSLRSCLMRLGVAFSVLSPPESLLTSSPPSTRRRPVP